MLNELLIQGGHVVTVDSSLGDFVDGDVLVRDGVIAEVGHHLVDGDVLKRDGHLVGVHVERARQLMHETRDLLRG
jgi:cytosine/adenosine deaminase-related metal-dependent hydrolase